MLWLFELEGEDGKTVGHESFEGSQEEADAKYRELTVLMQSRRVMGRLHRSLLSALNKGEPGYPEGR